MHSVFMAIGFNGFGCRIANIDMIGKPARVNRPAIAFCLTLGNHFSKQPAGPTRLHNTKGKDTRLKRVLHARHWPD